MQLSDRGGQLASRPAPNPTVSPGWINNDLTQTTPPTIGDPDMMNAIMAELLSVLTAAGLTPDKTNVGQLLAALQTLFGGGSASTGNPGYLELPLGFIINFGNQTVAGGTTDAMTYAKPFVSAALVCSGTIGGTNTASAPTPPQLNIRQAGASLSAGQITNAGATPAAYDWWVLGK